MHRTWKYHRILELEETPRAIHSNPCQAGNTIKALLTDGCQASASRPPKTETFLGSKSHCRTALTVRKFFLMFRWNLLSCSLNPLPRVRFSGAAENNLSPPGYFRVWRFAHVQMPEMTLRAEAPNHNPCVHRSGAAGCVLLMLRTGLQNRSCSQHEVPLYWPGSRCQLY